MNEEKNLTKPSFGQYLKAIGPAIVISAVVVGPGSVTTASQMGANYGYQLLWVVVLAALAAFFYQLPALRIKFVPGSHHGAVHIPGIRLSDICEKPHLQKRLLLPPPVPMQYAACPAHRLPQSAEPVRA